MCHARVAAVQTKRHTSLAAYPHIHIILYWDNFMGTITLNRLELHCETRMMIHDWKNFLLAFYRKPVEFISEE